MQDLAALPLFLTSFGVGLMLGLERERRVGTHAGLRTFALVGVAGTACALLAEQSGAPWLLPAAALGLLLMMVAADVQHPAADGQPDTTTTVALLLCFLFGAMLWHGYVVLTVALALGVTALLYFKAELHDASHRLTRQDMVSLLQFAVITFVVLPVLPDQGYGPYGQLNPYNIWLMVVLVSGIGLAGYAVLRIAPDARAVPVLGLLGGLISSTATTLVFSRHARRDPLVAPAALAVILIANLIVPMRIAVLAMVIAPGALVRLGPVLAAGVLAGVIGLVRNRAQLAHARAPAPDLENPVGLRSALLFGAIYALVLVLGAALHAREGALGIYSLAAVSGLGDMDAIAISTLRLLGETSPSEATRAIAIALTANMAFKALIVLTFAGRRSAGHVALHYAAVVAGLAAAIAGTL